MNYYHVRDLKPGLSCDRPIYIDNDTMFIPADVPIREKDLERLKKWGVRDLQSEGILSKSNDEETSDERKLWGIPSDDGLLHFYTDILNKLDSLFDKIKLKQDVETGDFDRISNDLIELVENKKTQILTLILTHNQEKQRMAKNALNSSIIALTIAFAMNMPRFNLRTLSNGVLLHDIGMTRIPETITKKKNNLDSEEINTLQSHSVLSYQIISRELGFDEKTAQIALEHHERWDGDGYPLGKKENDIIPESRIAARAIHLMP